MKCFELAFSADDCRVERVITFLSNSANLLISLYQTDILHTNFFPYRYRKLADSSFYRTILTNVYPKECAAECLARMDYDCLSFDYDRVLLKCSLADAGITVGLLPTDDSYPIDHYEIGKIRVMCLTKRYCLSA